jgi:N-hydroxyarylamine O-acetyltransferase
MAATDDLLALIGLAERPPATLAGLRAVHRAYVAGVPYENLAVQLGESGPLDDLASARRLLAGAGRGGYCFELNGGLALLLEDLGFAVARHQAVVGPRDADPVPPTNHLALVVELDGRRWLADAGIGEGFVEPLPLEPGRHALGPFAWDIAREDDGTWWIGQHEWGAIPGFRMAPEPSPAAAFAEHHTRMSTSPESRFVQMLVLQRVQPDRVVTLRSRTLTRRGPGVDERRVLASAEELAEVLRDVFGVDPEALGPERLARLWRQVVAQHEEFVLNAEPSAPA